MLFLFVGGFHRSWSARDVGHPRPTSPAILCRPHGNGVLPGGGRRYHGDAILSCAVLVLLDCWGAPPSQPGRGDEDPGISLRCLGGSSPCPRGPNCAAPHAVRGPVGARASWGLSSPNLSVLHLVRTPCPVLPRFPVSMPVRSQSSATSARTAVPAVLGSRRPSMPPQPPYRWRYTHCLGMAPNPPTASTGCVAARPSPRRRRTAAALPGPCLGSSSGPGRYPGCPTLALSSVLPSQKWSHEQLQSSHSCRRHSEHVDRRPAKSATEP